ncbi:hypothetical protein [Tepidibacter mesophilus]|uniref:hypothetical protein n=1 Tax=Tepidibacter mesophilus TaxID=655607 RepID=UPI000C06F56B|nr:hypothetical protein [Tepidibacter mesophilus]
MSKKKILLEINEDSEYYKFIEEHRGKRELSFTACAKQLLFDKIDDLKKEDIGEIKSLITKLTTNNVQPEEIKVKEEVKTKKDMLKNIKNLKK